MTIWKRITNRVRRVGFGSTLHEIVDLCIRRTIQTVLDPVVRWDRFGWIEAIAYAWRIDVWFRHSHVGREIDRLAAGRSRVTILDVGGAGASLSRILDPHRFHITCVDLRPLKDAGSPAAYVAGDGRALPFRDGSFDLVVSIDSLEHVPEDGKWSYLLEMRRTARLGIVLHCPAFSCDGRFRGHQLDREFMQRHESLFGQTDPFTREHLERGLPSVELIHRAFPGAELRGTETGPVWLDYMIRERRPFSKYLSGIRYRLLLQQADGRPPYHAVLATFDLGTAAARHAV